jgi:hypothetical protein
MTPQELMTWKHIFASLLVGLDVQMIRIDPLNPKLKPLMA